MDKTLQDCCRISDQDIRAALQDIKAYVDITEEDLRKIYEIALEHAQKRLAATISVRDVMTRDVITVLKDDDIQETARLLSEGRVSGLPVVDDENRVIGIISEADLISTTGIRQGHTFRDIVRHLLGEPLPSRKKTDIVAEAMTSPAMTIKEDADIGEAARVLDDRRIKRLPVVDDANRLIGIISRADIVRAMRK